MVKPVLRKTLNAAGAADRKKKRVRFFPPHSEKLIDRSSPSRVDLPRAPHCHRISTKQREGSGYEMTYLAAETVSRPTCSEKNERPETKRFAKPEFCSKYGCIKEAANKEKFESTYMPRNWCETLLRPAFSEKKQSMENERPEFKRFAKPESSDERVCNEEAADDDKCESTHMVMDGDNIEEEIDVKRTEEGEFIVKIQCHGSCRNYYELHYSNGVAYYWLV